MPPLVLLHALAAPRGDGLRPELLALFEHRAAVAGGEPRITELCRHRADFVVQSGPNPGLAAAAPLPEGVVRFPGRPACQQEETECISR